MPTVGEFRRYGWPFHFRTVETVNESAQERQRAFSFDSPAYRPKEWRNRLIWG